MSDPGNFEVLVGRQLSVKWDFDVKLVDLYSYTTQPNYTLEHTLTNLFVVSSSESAGTYASLAGRCLGHSRNNMICFLLLRSTLASCRWSQTHPAHPDEWKGLPSRCSLSSLWLRWKTWTLFWLGWALISRGEDTLLESPCPWTEVTTSFHHHA